MCVAALRGCWRKLVGARASARVAVSASTTLRRLLLCLAAGAASLVIGCGVTDDGTLAAVDCGSYRFPSKTWKATNNRVDKSDSELRDRRRGADALARCELIRGMPKSAVKARLGMAHEQRPSSWLYVVGAERGSVQLDDEVLLVKFHDNRVTRVVQGET